MVRLTALALLIATACVSHAGRFISQIKGVGVGRIAVQRCDILYDRGFDTLRKGRCVVEYIDIGMPDPRFVADTTAAELTHLAVDLAHSGDCPAVKAIELRVRALSPNAPFTADAAVAGCLAPAPAP